MNFLISLRMCYVMCVIMSVMKSYLNFNRCKGKIFLLNQQYNSLRSSKAYKYHESIQKMKFG